MRQETKEIIAAITTEGRRYPASLTEQDICPRAINAIDVLVQNGAVYIPELKKSYKLVMAETPCVEMVSRGIRTVFSYDETGAQLFCTLRDMRVFVAKSIAYYYRGMK